MCGISLRYKGCEGSYCTGTYEFVNLDQQAVISSLRHIGGIKFGFRRSHFLKTPVYKLPENGHL